MNLRQFDLNLLVALDVLLRERNVTRAAERLSMSQSAMSGILSRLRHAFDDALLVRVGQKLEPTELAAEITPRVHEIVQELAELFDSGVRFDPATDCQSFRIAATDYTVLLLFGLLLQKLARNAPNMSVHSVRLDLNTNDRLANAEIDFGILPTQFEAGLPSTPLFEDDWVCAASERHPVRGDHLTLDEFLKHPHIAFNISDPEHTSLADGHMAKSGYERRVVASTESFTTVPFLLKDTSMLAVLPRRLGEAMREGAGIRLFELPFEVPRLKQKLAWSPRFTSSLRHEWMRRQIIEVAGTI